MSDTSTSFVVPGEVHLPPELVGDPPRELPDSIKYGPVAQTERRAFWGCLIAAALCFAMSALPFVKTLELYILPLAYLDWIGVALVVLACSSYFGFGHLKKSSRYVRQGHAGFGRVVELVKYASVLVNDQPTAYAFQATVQALHPGSDQPVCLQVKSLDFQPHLKDHIETRFRVGDFVPVVWLPDRFEKTFQVYDFLELTPDSSLLRGQIAGKPLWQTLATVIFVFGFFFALFWNVYAFQRYAPLDFDFVRSGLWPFIIGGSLGLLAAVVGYRSSLKKRKQVEQRNVEAVSTGKAIELTQQRGRIRTFLFGTVIVAGSILLSGVTFLCWCYTANALLDDSLAKPENVEITEMIEVTHSFIFREYKLKYRRANQPKDDEMLTTPDHLNQFVVPQGVAQVRAGKFGWPWVDTIDPVFVPVGPANGN
jgi:hypothetical protein